MRFKTQEEADHLATLTPVQWAMLHRKESEERGVRFKFADGRFHLGGLSIDPTGAHPAPVVALMEHVRKYPCMGCGRAEGVVNPKCVECRTAGRPLHESDD